ncbi:MAG: pyrroline-5-carboxylate reductase [Gemmatimonadetes bacterium]|nr:pyrroline-5-carboxylate reductase [Gemmatimonadota bacterium]
MARGWLAAGMVTPDGLWVTRRRQERLAPLAEKGVRTGADNRAALAACDVLVIAVQPQQIEALLDEVAPEVEASRHRVISVASGVSVAALRDRLGPGVPIARAMPNTAVAIRESMTCLAAAPGDEAALEEARGLFGTLGRTLVIREEMMVPATALCACGVAFFLRAVRAASQGGIEIGFHPAEALLLASQTARGAASLLVEGQHPEAEIDRVTTPRGCTIAGLNEMEHQGFSSALIKGILLSSEKAAGLYEG